VRQLLAGSPRVVAFDIGFFEPTADDADVEAAFAEARSQRPPTRIVLAAVGSLPPSGGAAVGSDGDLTFTGGLEPLARFAANAEVGFTNVLPDERGIIRSMPLLARFGGLERPALGLSAAAAYLRRPAPLDSPTTPGSVRSAGRDIPVDGAKRVKINYFGPPSDVYGPASTFQVVSFVDVLRGRIDPDVWRNGLVFVGALGATGLADDYWTPVSPQGGRKMAGVEIHANVAATIFSAQFLRDAPIGTQIALIFGLAALVAVLVANLGVLGAVAAALILMAAFIGAELWAVHALGLLLPVTSPVIAGIVPLVGMLAYRVTLEQRRARGLLAALASVIPPTVAREIARDPDRVRLGGERRIITVLFADLKGFTSFSESVEPEILNRVITEFLEAMTQVIFRHGGTVDKFIGDAVMALWNAPLDDPEHARHACEAALEMQSTLSALSVQWQRDGLPRQSMRIGINTGPASVGNMGTRQRFAYTALGDTINLAARLEPLNGLYGTSVSLSRTTLDASGGYERFLMRFLDLVEVKGKRAPVPIYELVGCLDVETLAERHLPVLGPYRQAVALYQAQEFEAAGRLFLIASHGSAKGIDQPSRLYVERCAEYVQSPPAPDWDGVFRTGLRAVA
jgi:adenylate cyclase